MVREYLRYVLGLSRTRTIYLKKLDDGIVLNGRRVTVRAALHEGDILSLALEEREDSNIERCGEMPEVLYEDESVLVVDKPALMPTHPTSGHYNDTLANAVCNYYSDRNFVFRAIGRLDRDTDGPVVIAKNAAAAHRLSTDVVRGGFEKRYIALTEGIPRRESGYIENYIVRDGDSLITRHCEESGIESDFSKTEYNILKTKGDCALVECRPITGKTHQIRVHMASVGCPLIGDGLYNKSSKYVFGRAALHCNSVKFSHPVSGEIITVESKMKKDMTDFISALEERYEE